MGAGLIPQVFTTRNYSDLLESSTLNYSRWFMNSLKVSTISVCCILIFTSVSAYTLSRFWFRTKRYLLASIMILNGFPGILAMIAVYSTLRIPPGIPITINSMAPNSGLDYWSFAEHLDVVSWDNYPHWHAREHEVEEAVKTAFFHDLFRSLKNWSFMMMESTPSVTNWQGISVPKKGNMHLLSSLQAVAHGSDTVQYFQRRQSRGARRSSTVR